MACVLVSLPAKGYGAQEQRIALVIGNSNYLYAPLRNPVNDANDMAAALRKLGFRVTLRTDAARRTMKEAIRVFGKALQSGGVGLFYYAGHGIQSRGSNYLIPVHAEIQSEADVEYEAIDAGRVLAQMEMAGNNLNIVILDACRNNPFARSFRSGEKGLARMDAPTGSVLAYSTAPGSVAADGSGRNGLYTAKLLKHLQVPGITVERMFKLVRRDVTRESGKAQVHWESSSMIGDFYFSGGNPDSGQTGRAIKVQGSQTAPLLDGEEEMWQIVRESAAIEDFRMFLQQYPRGRFSGAAAIKIKQLERQQKTLQPIAAVSPKVAKTSTAQSRPDPLRRHRLVLFPVKIVTSWQSKQALYEASTIKAIDNLSREYETLDFAATYKKNRDLSADVALLSDMVSADNLKVWHKKSFVSKPEPDWNQIKKICQATGTDIAVMVSMTVANEGSMDVYIYDHRRGKIRSALGKTTTFTSIEPSVRQYTSMLLSDLLKKR